MFLESPHMGRYPNDLMHERYPEYVIKWASSGMDTIDLETGHADEPFFNYRRTNDLQKVNIRAGTQAFFDVPGNRYDLWIRVRSDKIEFYDDNQGQRLIGILDLDITQKHTRFLGAVPIYLTSQQKVFSQQSFEMSQANIDYFASVSMDQVYIPAKYKSLRTGTIRPALCDYGPYGLNIGGEINGEIFNQIIYQ